MKEKRERYEVKRLDYSLNVKLTDNSEPDYRYIIFDSVNDEELAKLETVCDWLNQQDKRIKESEQQLSKDFTLGEYIRLEQENQQLKQQLLTFGHRISDQNEEILELKQQLEDTEESYNNTMRYLNKTRSALINFPKKIVKEIKEKVFKDVDVIPDYHDEYNLRLSTRDKCIECLDTILKKYGGENESICD